MANLLPAGKVVADIGTDHAYLPVYLIKNSIVPRVIAVELNPGPLEAAKNTVAKYGLQGKVELRRGDGLKPIMPGEAAAAVIAGMGGATINSILAESLEVAKSLKKIILQPMSDAHLVRSYLQSHGFRLVDEELVLEDNRYYEVLVVQPGDSSEFDDIMLEIGPILFSKRHPLLAGYLEEKICHYKQIIDSLDRSCKVGAQEKKQYFEEKVYFLEKVISCLLDVPR
jgi:tRNA (adenine22-N1)-methyltransferase